MKTVKIEVPLELVCVLAAIMAERSTIPIDPIGAAFLMEEFSPEIVEKGIKFYEKITQDLKSQKRKKLASRPRSFQEIRNA